MNSLNTSPWMGFMLIVSCFEWSSFFYGNKLLVPFLLTYALLIFNHGTSLNLDAQNFKLQAFERGLRGCFETISFRKKNHSVSKITGKLHDFCKSVRNNFEFFFNLIIMSLQT